MKLFSDKYKPVFHPETIPDDHIMSEEQIKMCSFNQPTRINTDTSPHLLIYGPESCGKMCSIQNHLASQYGKGIHALRSKQWEFQAPSKTLVLNVQFTHHHFILNPSSYGPSYDKFILSSFLKDISSTSNVSRFFDLQQSSYHKIVVINHADALSRSAQKSLTNLMEKSIVNCRIILSCRNLSKIVDPIISRCLKTRLCPSEQDMLKVAQKICGLENFNLSTETLNTMVKNASFNYRKLLNNLQVISVETQYGKLTNHMVDPLSVVEQRMASTISAYDKLADKVFDVAIDIQSIRQLAYDLLSVSQRPGHVLHLLASAIIKRLKSKHMDIGDCDSPHRDMKLINQTLNLACDCDFALTNGSKPIVHIEAFVLQVAKIVQINTDLRRLAIE